MDINKMKKEAKKKIITPIPKEEVGVITTPTQEPIEDISLDVVKDDFFDYDFSSEESVNKQIEYFATKGLSKEKLYELLDAILTRNDVRWEFKLLGKIPVMFRLRPAWVNDELSKYLDEFPPKSVVSFQEQIGRYNLAGSLFKYNTQEINVKTKEDLEAALTFIGALPYVIKSALITELAFLDRVVAVITSEVMLRNFTIPPQEN